ncbi:leader peptidase (prepilin peptidase) / N-methyltransferase [Amycolatopsis arida]|uniref:Leader peptidase (Prepilin peptidase) / N-methyltransferase n=1 Tax=Amycolatopsis arida TaxID=587909 RepID=A0A1I5Z452_9PSEU|nr:A24 family peptidase [Amycolatopsis arida]TDX90124.1 leader peptidase (prepilin peptidase)/N-methyltransferase [Amycolatopsis arida]SFQ51254.1 leader peptidase (prepilin peptidase) / N-methyltransferase [Amycolatopsis arida]
MSWHLDIAFAVLAFAAAGLGVGRAGRWALRRSRVPIVLPVGWCELTTAVLWSAVALRWLTGGWPAWWLPVPLAVTGLAVPLALADARHLRLPDVLTLPAYPVLGAAVAVAALAAPAPGLAGRAALAAIVFGGLHALVHVVVPDALGAGDVKLAGSLGAALGASGWAALLLAACLAAVVSVVLVAAATLRHVVGRRDGPGGRRGVPHGVGLLAGAVLAVVFPGTELEVDMGS